MDAETIFSGTLLKWIPGPQTSGAIFRLMGFLAR